MLNVVAALKQYVFESMLEFIDQIRFIVYSRENSFSVSRKVYYTGELNRIKIGKGTRINRGANFRFKDGGITIGENCLIGRDVSIISNSYIIDSLPISVDRMKSSNINIGNNVLIGNSVIILPGVNIGDGAVIGANSVVTKDIQPYTVHAGVPNKLIKQRK